MALCAAERWDLVDVGIGADEEDALNGGRGQGTPGQRVGVHRVLQMRSFVWFAG